MVPLKALVFFQYNLPASLEQISLKLKWCLQCHKNIIFKDSENETCVSYCVIYT